jgi:hypothetical protein
LGSRTFRDGLLDGRRVAFEGASDSAIVVMLRRLGAEVAVDENESPLRALVHDARPGFGSGGEAALHMSIERAWVVARAVATGTLIADGHGGRLLFIAPSDGSGPYAAAGRSALENLARTLSVEWARYGVTAVALWPGSETTDDQLAELICFLVSDAGGYFSGCRFELGVS